MQIPAGHQTVMPYLMLADAKSFIEFTKKVFGAEHSFNRLKADQQSIMHGEIRINECTIMFCDSGTEWPVQNANLFIYVDNADETYQLALENGGLSKMELSDQDYGRTCGVDDPCGNTWWITSIKQS